ncbi:hypothetical protein R3P38DRAFT_3368062 [Favolaschia claudopus]|uniref:Uncharacterized protein n=1 Tax=Favolaschia claudopus TaxID=2862362 RepID=A0AAW0A794_9AGAR
MTTLTTALLSPFSLPFSLLRIFFPFSYPTSPSPSPTPTLPASKSDSLCSAPRPRHRHAQGVATRRPNSEAAAVEGYWRWAGPEAGVILYQYHHQHHQCQRVGEEEEEAGKAGLNLNLKTLADVQVSHPSPVFACRPRRVRTYYPAPEESAGCGADEDAVDAVLHALDTDTSASSSSFDSDTSFTLPPPPPPHPHPRANNNNTGLGLGITGLFKADGSPFDGMGVVSFGARAEPESSESREHESSSPRRRAGLSRAFLEEAERTWAADPHHRILSVIEEEQLEEEGEGDMEQLPPRVEGRGRERLGGRVQHHAMKNPTKPKTTRPVVRERDLSTLDTISSKLKRRQDSRSSPKPKPKSMPSSSSGPLRRSPSKELSARPRTPLPVWHR